MQTAAAKLSLVDAAKLRLATAMMNQVGVEWDECCDSAEIFARRQGDVHPDTLATLLEVESYRYEDM